MKKTIFSVLLSFSFLTVALAIGEPNSVAVDASESSITWKGYKVTGAHDGTISLNGGELVYEDGRLAGGTFEINMSDLIVTDLDGNMKGKLEGHLKSPDFFAVEEFPTAILNITNVASRGPEGEYKVTADLTIKGITNKIKFNAVDSGTNVTANITVDRSEYNVRYGSGSFFDNLGDNSSKSGSRLF